MNNLYIAVDYIGCEMQLALSNAHTTLNGKNQSVEHPYLEINPFIPKQTILLL